MSAASKGTPLRTPRARLDTLKNVRRGTTPRMNRPNQKTTPQCANPNCVQSDVAEDDGKLICRSCGYVLSDVQITQELTFGEAANGAAVVQGVYVGANEESARNPGLGPSKLTGGMDSRQVTERNGQHHISNLVAALRLSATQKERAYLMWTLAMNQNFIQGRVTRHVAAVCLYIACRHDTECRLMLVDFSDLLEMNVFKLGQIYTAFVEALNLNDKHLNLGLVNPENLIHRFAQDLEFGADEHKIANEAVQVLKRLDRDWITTGRRPAGVCAAALILAARMNNYRRTVREVIYTAKVCEITINKRLDEFRFTDSSKLTVEEFRHHGENLAAVHDPPAFYQQFEDKRKERQAKIIGSEPDATVNESLVEAEDDTMSVGRQISDKARRDGAAMPPPPPPIDPALLSGDSEEHLNALAQAEGTRNENAAAVDSEAETESVTDSLSSSVVGGKRKRGRKKGSKNKPLPELCEGDVNDEANLEVEVQSILNQPDIETHASEAHQVIEQEHSVPPQANALESSITLRDGLSRKSPVPSVLDSEVVSASEFLDDPEVENAILSPAEIIIKERIWVHENADYLRIQQARKLKHELAVSAGTAKVPRKRSRPKKPRIGDTTHYSQQRDAHGNLIGASSPAESVKMMLSHRGYSKKLDYATVEKLYKYKSKSPTASDVSQSDRGSIREVSELDETLSPVRGYPGPVRGMIMPLENNARTSSGQPDGVIRKDPILIEDDEDDDDNESS